MTERPSNALVTISGRSALIELSPVDGEVSVEKLGWALKEAVGVPLGAAYWPKINRPSGRVIKERVNYQEIDGLDFVLVPAEAA